MKVIGVIPARYASTRFPGKPLALIQGRPMLQWVVEAARKCADLDRLIVATDDERIAELCRRIAVDVVMTDPSLPSGSDRVWAVVKNMDADVAVNIQGDEPLLDPRTLAALVEPWRREPGLDMATLAHACAIEDLGNPNAAKVLVDRQGNAIYFSRFGVPYSRLAASSGRKGHEGELAGVLRHIGLYAFRKSFLAAYCEAGPCEIETAEGLEQLRALYLGARIRVVRVNTESCGVDTPEDVKKIEAIIQRERQSNDR